jgi:hypothetical protein
MQRYAAAKSPGRVVVAQVLIVVDPGGTVVMQPDKKDVPAVNSVLYESHGESVVATLSAAGQTLASVTAAYRAMVKAGIEYKAGESRFGRMSGHGRFDWQGRTLQLVRADMLGEGAPEEKVAPVRDEVDTCCICMDNKVDSLILPCQHQVCVTCINTMLGGRYQHSRLCALCRQPMREVLTQYGMVCVSQSRRMDEVFYEEDDEDDDDE